MGQTTEFAISPDAVNKKVTQRLSPILSRATPLVEQHSDPNEDDNLRAIFSINEPRLMKHTVDVGSAENFGTSEGGLLVDYDSDNRGVNAKSELAAITISDAPAYGYYTAVHENVVEGGVNVKRYGGFNKNGDRSRLSLDLSTSTNHLYLKFRKGENGEQRVSGIEYSDATTKKPIKFSDNLGYNLLLHMSRDLGKISKQLAEKGVTYAQNGDMFTVKIPTDSGVKEIQIDTKTLTLDYFVEKTATLAEKALNDIEAQKSDPGI